MTEPRVSALVRAELARILLEDAYRTLLYDLDVGVEEPGAVLEEFLAGGRVIVVTPDRAWMPPPGWLGMPPEDRDAVTMVVPDTLEGLD